MINNFYSELNKTLGRFFNQIRLHPLQNALMRDNQKDMDVIAGEGIVFMKYADIVRHFSGNLDAAQSAAADDDVERFAAPSPLTLHPRIKPLFKLMLKEKGTWEGFDTVRVF